MTIKEMVTSVYQDMQVIRPQVQSLAEANLPTRMSLVENHIRDEDLVSQARGDTKRQLLGYGSRGLQFLILGTQVAIAFWVASANHLRLP